MRTYSFARRNDRAKAEWPLAMNPEEKSLNDYLTKTYPVLTFGAMFPEISSLFEIYSAKRMVLIRSHAKLVVFYDKHGNIHVRHHNDQSR